MIPDQLVSGAVPHEHVLSQKFRPQDRVVLCSEAEISFVDLHQVIPVLLEQFSAAENLQSPSLCPRRLCRDQSIMAINAKFDLSH